MDYMANGMEMNLLEPEERKEVEFIWNLIPAEDKQGISEEDVLIMDGEFQYGLQEGWYEE